MTTYNVVFTDADGYTASVEVITTDALDAVRMACGRIKDTERGAQLGRVASVDVEDET